MNPARLRKVMRILLPLAALYLFFYSIDLIGHSFKLFGKGFAERLLSTTSDPFLGLFIGLVTTSVIQSSSATTSIIVGLVAAGSLSISAAIPMIMGANIGTTVTNLIVSLGHAARRFEFNRAFSCAVVHDIFNVLTVIVLFPIELVLHPLQKSAVFLAEAFSDAGGLSMSRPLKHAVEPLIHLTDRVWAALNLSTLWMAVLALVVLFFSLAMLVKALRRLALCRAEVFIDRYLFGNPLASLLLGLLLTIAVQSSSVTTSLIVPLAGAGIVNVRQVFPYVLGANVGTTTTAVLASLATGSSVAVTVAFAHMMFNIFGIAVFYPLRVIPITIASKIGEFIGRSDRNVVIVVGCFLLLYFLPIILFVAEY